MYVCICVGELTQMYRRHIMQEDEHSTPFTRAFTKYKKKGFSVLIREQAAASELIIAPPARKKYAG